MSYAMDVNQYYDPYIWQICRLYGRTPSEIPFGLLDEIYAYDDFKALVDYFEGRPVKSLRNPNRSYLLLANCGTKASNVVFDEFIYQSFPSIEKVIFNGPATIVMWSDGTKTVVKCQEGDEYSKQTGLLMCVFKKAFGAKNDLEKMLNELCSVENGEGGLGRGTCEILGYDDGYDEGVDGEMYQYADPRYFLSCEHEAYGSIIPNYCPVCGRKVVDEWL